MSDVSAVPGRTRRTPRWLLAILVVSLLLNGLIAGAVVARWWAGGPGPHFPGSSVNAHLVGFAVTLPGERRREIWKSTEAEREKLRPIRKAMQEARASVQEALVASPFDSQRFAEAQKRLFEAEQVTRVAMLKQIQTIAELLTPEERAAFAEWENKDRDRRRTFWRKMREDNKGADPALESGKPAKK
jgi:uncharacterized membrane protein